MNQLRILLIVALIPPLLVVALVELDMVGILPTFVSSYSDAGTTLAGDILLLMFPASEFLTPAILAACAFLDLSRGWAGVAKPVIAEAVFFLIANFYLWGTSASIPDYVPVYLYPTLFYLMPALLTILAILVFRRGRNAKDLGHVPT